MKRDNKPLTSVTREKVAWSLPEASQATSLSVSLLRKFIRDGKLKKTKVGRRVVIMDLDLQSFLTRA